MEYQLTKKGKEKVISFIKYCKETREILLKESSMLDDETKLQMKKTFFQISHCL